MPRKINSNTIIITLEGIEKAKTEKRKKTKQSSLKNYASVYKLNGF